jgi:hypothetical protein
LIGRKVGIPFACSSLVVSHRKPMCDPQPGIQ